MSKTGAVVCPPNREDEPITSFQPALGGTAEECEMSQQLGRTIADAHDSGLPASRTEVQSHHRQQAEQGICDQSEADLSYELRTILAVITLVSGNLDLLYDQLNVEQRQKMIRDIRKHTEKMNDVIADVLELCNAHGAVAM